MAVSKGHPPAAVAAAYDAGARDFGEARPDELRRKADFLRRSGRLGCRWHFVGRLQRNKLRQLVGSVELFQSVDRPEVVDRLAALAAEKSLRQPLLLQVNLGREPQKGGILPAELEARAAQVAAHASLRLTGLMALPPRDATRPEDYFAELRRMTQSLQRAGHSAAVLSMGMSDDFEAAIAQGATMVRLGTALFGPRPEKT